MRVEILYVALLIKGDKIFMKLFLIQLLISGIVAGIFCSNAMATQSEILCAVGHSAVGAGEVIVSLPISAVGGLVGLAVTIVTFPVAGFAFFEMGKAPGNRIFDNGVTRIENIHYCWVPIKLNKQPL